MRRKFQPALIAGMILAAPQLLAAADCQKLASLKLADTTITLAESVPAGGFAPPAGGVPIMPGLVSYKSLPAFCRVAATAKPSRDSEIKFEVWMPEANWNGKFEGTGNGGWLGEIIYPALALGLSRGFAVANTDTGHTSGVMDASWALGHPEKVTDFAYRAVHEMTVQGKAIVAAYYGKSPSYSYWNGCSSGGKQGLKEAQKFPGDYNGIVAGAPANYWTHLTAATVWVGLLPLKTPASAIPAEKFPFIHKAALQACDALDGIKDGVIDDPRNCHFDPQALLCKAGDAPDCLTAAQVETARKVYGPATTAKGVKFFPGLEPGSELVWGFMLGGPEPSRIGSDYYTYIIHQDPHWDPRTMDFDKDVPFADKFDHGAINAMDPNLTAFKAHGGKLIMYHGWADALIPSQNSINYYNSVVKAMGGAQKTDDFFRLFMAPGMGHCFGGEGPNVFDALAPLEQWVEKGNAPESIVASHFTASNVDRTRPLCVYPKVARYNGTGSTDQAANFSCKAPD
ncbi:MAG TPA: tannase/feruloyl esterase family alpha/beta hydrolase [Terriglobales bacterium]|nr:tannase/feruloyl esterase family alpha/beta hydrolase [Terriglobales bacterium]